MHIDGHNNYEPNEEICVIPRTHGDDFVFTAKALMDLDDFDKLCPVPEPPAIIKPGGVKEFDFKNQSYLDALVNHSKQRIAYFVIKSLEATKGLSWSRVKPSNPKTWHFYAEELKEAGFNYLEIQRIEAAVFTANCLNEEKVQQARQNFLLEQELAAKESIGAQGTQNSSQSGSPANDSK